MKLPKFSFDKIIAGVMGAAMLFAVGCSTDSTPGMGTMQVKLHDAPADYDEVNVFIERVEVNNTADSEQGWQVVGEPMQSFDLLELTNGVFEVIGETELEAGFYPQVRLVVSSDGHSVVIDGESHSMMVPSGAQTGIKLNVNAEIQEGIVYTLLLDFDALRSVRKTGQASNPGYILQPVIRATNEAVSGNIEGMIEPIDARAAVFAIAGEDTLSSSYANEETGYFMLVGLEEGSYSVSVEPREEGFGSEWIDEVSVTVGESTDLGTIELDTADNNDGE